MGLDFDVLGFLSEPLRPASVATVTARRRPALATMWYLLADGRFWFHTPETGSNPFLRSARTNDLVSVMVDTFHPTGPIKKVRATGPAAIADTDYDRVTQIYDRYLGPANRWDDAWRRQVTHDEYFLWSMEPATGSAVQYPELRNAGGMYRWASANEFFEATASFRPDTS